MSDHPISKFYDRFPIRDRLIFLNHAAVAPISGPAGEALLRYSEQATCHSYVNAGWYRAMSRIRENLAKLVAADSADEIAFIPNTSTGLALVAEGMTYEPGDQVVITNVEYPANRYPWENLKRFGVELVEVAQRDDGSVRSEDVIAAVTPRTKVVSISMVQYASGCRTELRGIADAVHAEGGYLCVDGIQAVGAMPVDVGDMGIDFLSADGHKWMLGPEGAGFLYVRRDLIQEMHPAVVGWMGMVDANDYGSYRFELLSDARRFEPGTWNVPGLLALGASVELLLEVGVDRVWGAIEGLTGQLCEGLAEIGWGVFSPRGEGQRSGIVTFDTPGGVDPKRVANELENRGIIVAVREGRLRASPHFYNDAGQVEQVVGALGALSG